MRLRCDKCGCVRETEGVPIDVVEGVMTALKRAKLSPKFPRRQLCDALRWAADFLDVKLPGMRTTLP